MTTTASGHTAPHRHPAPLRTPGSRLGPQEDFPQALTGLGMTDLQVLHSRVTCQLDHDWLTDPAGPHSVTMDRCVELAAELDARDTARDHTTRLEPSPTGTPPWTPQIPKNPPRPPRPPAPRTPRIRLSAGSTPSA